MTGRDIHSNVINRLRMVFAFLDIMVVIQPLNTVFKGSSLMRCGLLATVSCLSCVQKVNNSLPEVPWSMKLGLYTLTYNETSDFAYRVLKDYRVCFRVDRRVCLDRLRDQKVLCWSKVCSRRRRRLDRANSSVHCTTENCGTVKIRCACLVW